MARPKSKTHLGKYSDTVLVERLNECITSKNVQMLSEKLNISVSAINMWKSGATRPDVDKLPKLSKALGVSTDYLLGLTDIPSTDEDIKTACKMTGLKPETIIAFQKSNSHDIETLGRLSLVALIDYLVKQEEDYEILQLIGVYLSAVFSPYARVSAEDLARNPLLTKEDIDNIVKKSETHFVVQDLFTDKVHYPSMAIMESAILTKIQIQIAKLKNDGRKKSDEEKR